MAGSSLDSKVRHRRSLGSLARAVLRPANYAGVIETFRLCREPVDFLSRYIGNRGNYPKSIRLVTPIGDIAPTIFSPDDVQTINEIFFRGDYRTDIDIGVVVDFGSNIGISASYFLSRNTHAHIYCYEPLPNNVARLQANLAPFAGRFDLAQVAVGESSGVVRFGWEPTGRYGGVGRDTGAWIDVECVDSNEVLKQVIERHGHIDLLKIDIETLEKVVTERIPADLARRIGHIVVEFPFADNPLAATHRMVRNNYVTAFLPTGDWRGVPAG